MSLFKEAILIATLTSACAGAGDKAPEFMPDLFVMPGPRDQGPEVTRTASWSPPQHRQDRVHLGFGSYADAGTTAQGLWSGNAIEINPLLAPFGGAAPFAALGLKYGMKKALVGMGLRPAQANIGMESASMLAACANIVTIAGAAPVAAFVAGVGCGALHRRSLRAEYRGETGLNPDGTPAGAVRQALQRPDRAPTSLFQAM